MDNVVIWEHRKAWACKNQPHSKRISIKEVFADRKEQVDLLRKDLRKTTKSPLVKNIFSEIFIKSLNSLVFNMAALKYKQNNSELDKTMLQRKKLLKCYMKVITILRKNNIKIYQSPESRVIQTLKSKNIL